MSKIEQFLRNIYQKGPMEGHPSVCMPCGTPIYEGDMEMLIREVPKGMRFILQRDTDDLDEAKRWLDCGRSAG